MVFGSKVVVVSWVECVLGDDDEEEGKLNLEVVLSQTLYSNPSCRATSSSHDPTHSSTSQLSQVTSITSCFLGFVAHSLGYVRHQSQSSPS